MTSSKLLQQTSQFLSYILRHKPDAIGLSLDLQGWANIDELITLVNLSHGTEKFNRHLINEVVVINDKKRFVISKDGQRIRASQGHSVDIDLQLKPNKPPEFLYHGTATRFLNYIFEQGLKPQMRQHVHLSSDVETAIIVGQRYGKPAVLEVKPNSCMNRALIFIYLKMVSG